MLTVMSDEIRFAPDLYRGTAGYYDRFRLPYPAALTADLVRRTAPSGRGRLLDLACGTGQLAFALCDRFAEVWAVDQEPDMVQMVRAKAAAAGAGHIRPVAASAEDLRADPGSFELAVIGNAFHRLRRGPVARLVSGWLQPGGFLALCWSTGPSAGPEEWQRAFADLLRRWQAALGADGRVPANWDAPRREHPDTEVLASAGFEPAGRYEFPAPHDWTVPELAGYVRSTSPLPPSVLGEHAAAFDAELAAALSPYARDGRLAETVSFACELARKPPAATAPRWP
jgi:SAM-dependent methyltransferase